MKNLLILLFVLFFFSCNDKEENLKETPLTSKSEFAMVVNARNSTCQSSFINLNTTINTLTDSLAEEIDYNLDYCSCDNSAANNLINTFEYSDLLIGGINFIDFTVRNEIDENDWIEMSQCSKSFEEKIDGIKLYLIEFSTAANFNQNQINDITSFIDEFFANPDSIDYCYYLGLASQFDDDIARQFFESSILFTRFMVTDYRNFPGEVGNDPQPILWHVVGGLGGAWWNAVTGVIRGHYNDADGGNKMLADMAWGFVGGALFSI